MIKSDFCLCENKGADQLCSYSTADQRLCFRYMDSTIPLLKSRTSSFKAASVTSQTGLCQTWSETTMTCFLASRLKIFHTAEANDSTDFLEGLQSHRISWGQNLESLQCPKSIQEENLGPKFRIFTSSKINTGRKFRKLNVTTSNPFIMNSCKRTPEVIFLSKIFLHKI